MANAVADMTAVEMIRLFQSRKLSPVEATQACLERIDKYNPRVNAYCLVDQETTLAEARASEARYQKGQPLGQVDGVPTAIKDVFLTKGWPTLKGSKTIDPNQEWNMDAPVIASLKRHGFVPLGKTTTPEFGWKGVTDSPLCGSTGNPWNPEKTAGGSSGGSASAVALGMGPLSLGTDAGGSIRIPAGFSGMFGLKPTAARVPFVPGSPFGFLAHVGPMTWTVEDAALLMNVICEWDGRDSVALPNDSCDYLKDLNAGVAGMKIAYSPNLGYVNVDPEIAEAVKKAVQRFEDLGAEIVEVDPGFSDPREAFDRLFFGGAANAMRNLGPEQRAKMDPNLVHVAEEAAKMDMLDYLWAINEKTALSELMMRFFLDYDLLLTPALPIPAFKRGQEVPDDWDDPRWPSWTPFTYPFNMTGHPAASVPCGFTSQGLPIGLQIVGNRYQDKKVLQASQAYEKAENWVDTRPSLDG
ncbi:amidase [Marinobacteraceae bacterium S3BR75-40.1]